MRKNLSSAESNQRPKLVTVEQLCELIGPGLTEAAIRSQLWAAQERRLRDGRRIPPNGLASAIVRLGRRVLVDVDAYFEWLESRRLAPRVDLEALREGAATVREDVQRNLSELIRRDGSGCA